MIESPFTIEELVSYCNKGLVPEKSYEPVENHYNEWFIDQFRFLDNDSLTKQLGETYYQTRFVYQLMNALQLPLSKHSGIVKFQVFQYVSICEALLDYAISEFFTEEIENQFSIRELKKVPALSSNATLSYAGEEIICCKEASRRGKLRDLRCEAKVAFAVDKGIISKEIGDQYKALYSQRNNIHVLRAAEEHYLPSVDHGKEAYMVMNDFIGEMKAFYEGRRG